MIREDIRAVLNSMFPQEEIIIDYVPRGKEGDYYTNLAFKIASREGGDPWQTAQRIAAEIQSPIIKRTAAYKPAFINFSLSDEYLHEQLRRSVSLDIGKGQRYSVEFVSANPTGPINVVSARAAAVGDALVRLLRKTGFHADAEYYINDTGRQTELLAESVRQRAIELKGGEAEIPENGYHGEYIKAVAKKIIEHGIEDREETRRFAVEYFIKDHQEVMQDFGVAFDIWTRESDIYGENRVVAVRDALTAKGLTYVEEGALHFKTTDYGDDKDRVIVTSDERNTYLLPDIAYHLHKLERNYDLLIDIWGPDHQGHIKGIKGALEAFGHGRDKLRVLIVQEVKIKEHGKLLSMSKRAGTFASLGDLLDKIPKDVVRFFFLMRSSSQHLEFDVDLALKQSDENPVYYVQYAYARIQSIIRRAEQEGIALLKDADLSVLQEPEELYLIRDILKYEEVLFDSVHNLEPYMITYYLIDLARDFHLFYQKHRVVSEDRKMSEARIYLIHKIASTIKDAMKLLGITCPDKM